MTAPQAPAPTDPPIAAADRATLLRSASLAWTASTVLLAVGLLLTAAWIWGVFRGQQRASQFFGGFPGEDEVSFVDRVDILLEGSVHLLAYAAIVTGAALALRLVADLAAIRVGGFASAASTWDESTEITLERDDDG